MTDVKHMKWWGWGEEGVFFNYANKPAFAPFVKKHLGIDLRPRQVDTIEFDATTVPDSPLPEPTIRRSFGVMAGSVMAPT